MPCFAAASQIRSTALGRVWRCGTSPPPSTTPSQPTIGPGASTGTWTGIGRRRPQPRVAARRSRALQRYGAGNSGESGSTGEYQPMGRAAPRVDVQQVGDSRTTRSRPDRVPATRRAARGLRETQIHGAIADEVEAPPHRRAGASAPSCPHRQVAADERVPELRWIDLDRQCPAADGVIAPEFRHREIDARRQKPAERPLHAVRANEALEIRVRAAGVAQEPGIGALGPRVDGAPHQLEEGLGARLETAP